MGFFIRKDFLESLNNECEDEREEDEDKPTKDLIDTADYKLIHSVEYPFFVDKRSRIEKISDEIDYQLNRMSWMEEYFNYEANRIEIPFNVVVNLCWQVSDSAEEVKNVVESKYTIEDYLVILPPNEIEQSSEEEVFIPPDEIEQNSEKEFEENDVIYLAPSI